MLTARSLKVWSWLHKWSSLVSAVCMLAAAVYLFIGLRPETRSSRELALLLSALFAISAAVVAVVNTLLGWSPATSVPVAMLLLIGALGYAGATKTRAA